MELREARELAIKPAFALLNERMATEEAEVMLLAIGLQESLFKHRRQMGNGPARGFWQFEKGGGVRGVLNHSATRDLAIKSCGVRGVNADPHSAWEAIEFDDVLAAVFARLLLWSDPYSLPALNDVKGAFALYLRTWRPGAYTRGTPAEKEKLEKKFAGYYASAVREVVR